MPFKSSSQKAVRRRQSLQTSNCRLHPSPRGMSLIEALVGSFLIILVFLSIFAAFQLSIQLVFSTKAASGGAALVNQQIEYVRALTYDAVGTSGGIPSGTIPQVQQITLNSIPYTLSTLIQYVDDPSDGTGAADTNGITADYKSVRVEANWTIKGQPRSTFAVTRIAPTGIESLASGGTLRVNVINTVAAPVSDASVHIVNSSVTPAIDLTVDTDTSGSVAFPGTPPGTGYQITVTKSGYSTAQTYGATGSNPNPNPGHLSVLNKTTTTLSLSIDLLGSLLVSTWSPPGAGSFSDTFSDQSKLAATSSVAVSGGVVKLSGNAGAYPTLGSAQSVDIAPSYLSGWTALSWNASTSPQASVTFSVYYWNGSAYVLIPNADLPNNSAGFSVSPVSLASVSAQTYPKIRIGAALSSTDLDWTPEVADWKVDYIAGPTPLPNVQFAIHGAKTIGTSAGGSPIYKMSETDTTSSSGAWNISPAEADAYTISLPSGSPYMIQEQCSSTPSVAPGASASVSLTMVAATTNSLRLVVSGGGSPLQGASATLTGNTVNQTVTTSACGQAFFGGIPAGTYTLAVSKTGYQTSTDTNVSVSGQSIDNVTLSP